MIKIFRNNAGFAAIEAIVVLVIIGMVGGTGYFVWHAKQATNVAAPVSTALPRTASFDLSLTTTYYDCLEAISRSTGDSGGGIDKATGNCRSNNTGGDTYTIPKKYSDDMIRNVRGFQFSAQEVSKLRSVGAEEFASCAMFSKATAAKIRVIGEADGRYLYINRNCGDGTDELLYLNGARWVTMSTGSVGLKCADIMNYHVPLSLLVAGYDTSCMSDKGEFRNTNTLPGYSSLPDHNI